MLYLIFIALDQDTLLSHLFFFSAFSLLNVLIAKGFAISSNALSRLLRGMAEDF